MSEVFANGFTQPKLLRLIKWRITMLSIFCPKQDKDENSGFKRLSKKLTTLENFCLIAWISDIFPFLFKQKLIQLYFPSIKKARISLPFSFSLCKSPTVPKKRLSRIWRSWRAVAWTSTRGQPVNARVTVITEV